ncbi:phazolicin family TOMM bacteriocin [uncultured Phyllobacterium sp.]|uniref:phazolicin family TOMM bacteriocin n=1 Tax=uncultured Phyllobacterium sp. TaxID=253813 RepID=UPI00338F5D4D
MLIHFLSPGQFGDQVEFDDDDNATMASGGLSGVSPGSSKSSSSAKCDSSSRCGASGKSSSSSASSKGWST